MNRKARRTWSKQPLAATDYAAIFAVLEGLIHEYRVPLLVVIPKERVHCRGGAKEGTRGTIFGVDSVLSSGPPDSFEVKARTAGSENTPVRSYSFRFPSRQETAA